MNLYNIKFEVINDNENSPIYGLVMGYVNTYITGENNEDAEKNMERKLQDRNVKIQKSSLRRKHMKANINCTELHISPGRRKNMESKEPEICFLLEGVMRKP